MQEEAIFAAGCFWGVEAAFMKVAGVLETEVGYIGGATESPTYEEVCGGGTGHKEAVRVRYDPERVSYEELLAIFWDVHTPTTRNRQGLDIGEQYHSVIYYHSDAQRKASEASKQALEEAHTYSAPIVTDIVPATTFYPAEEYHQQYLEKRGGGGVCGV